MDKEGSGCGAGGGDRNAELQHITFPSRQKKVFFCQYNARKFSNGSREDPRIDRHMQRETCCTMALTKKVSKTNGTSPNWG